MESPEINYLEEKNIFYFDVPWKYTLDLIAHLRKHLDGFDIKIGGGAQAEQNEYDVFDIPSGKITEAVLEGLLNEFFKNL